MLFVFRSPGVSAATGDGDGGDVYHKATKYTKTTVRRGIFTTTT